MLRYQETAIQKRLVLLALLLYCKFDYVADNWYYCILEPNVALSQNNIDNYRSTIFLSSSYVYIHICHLSVYFIAFSNVILSISLTL